MPFVSVLLPAFNYGRYLATAINSVISQTHDDFELLIFDNGSTDESKSIIASFQDRRIRRFYLRDNIGVEVFNRCLDEAKGEFITILHADDAFYPQKLEKQLAFFLHNPSYDLVATHVNTIDPSGLPFDSPECPNWWFNHKQDLSDIASYLGTNRVNMPSVMMTRRAVNVVGHFRTDLRFISDMDYWVRAIIKGLKFGMIAEPLVYYRRHKANGSVTFVSESVIELGFYFAKVMRPYLNSNGFEKLSEKYIESLLNNKHGNKLSERTRANMLSIILDGNYFEGTLEEYRGRLGKTPTTETKFLARRLFKSERLNSDLLDWAADLEHDIMTSEISNYIERYNSYVTHNSQKLLGISSDDARKRVASDKLSLQRLARTRNPPHQFVHFVDAVRKIAIYGTSGASRIAADIASDAHWEVVLYTDSKRSVWKKGSMHGVSIVSPTRLIELRPTYDLIIVATTLAKHKVFHFLHSHGLRYSRDFVYVFDELILDDRSITSFY